MRDEYHLFFSLHFPCIPVLGVYASNFSQGISFPDIFPPDISSPGISFPDISSPGISFPDISCSAISFPSLPGYFFPDTSAPNISVPGIFFPDISSLDIFSRVFFPDISFSDIFPWILSNHYALGSNSCLSAVNRWKQSTKHIHKSTMNNFTNGRWKLTGTLW